MMNYEYFLHLYCAKNQFIHHERLCETDFHVFVRDAVFSGMRKGVLKNGGRFRSRVLPVIEDRDNPWLAGDAVWLTSSGRRLGAFEVVVERGSESYRKRYPLRNFGSRALEKTLRATSCKDSLSSCGALRYFLVAFRKTDGSGQPEGARSGNSESRIRIHDLPESTMAFETGTMPRVVTDGALDISSAALSSLQEDYPVSIERHTLERIRQCARMNPDREVAGFLLGNVFQAESSEIFTIVDDQIEASHTRASLTDITIDSRTWTAFWNELKRRRSERKLVGWWHSHPFRISEVSQGREDACRDGEHGTPGRPAGRSTNLEAQTTGSADREDHSGAGGHQSSVFLSSHDIFIHDHFFSWPHQIALVVDPASDAEHDIGVWGWRDGVVKMRTAYVIPREVEV